MTNGGHHVAMTFSTTPIAIIDATYIARRTVRGAGADGTVPERPRRRTLRRRVKA
jgi:hypothetical protein